jgi:Uma2 family endonuclease
MSYPGHKPAPGFGERRHRPIEDIPTDTEAFLRWGTTLDPDHPFKYELSDGKVSRTMIQTTRGHWEITTSILAELLSKLDRSRFRAGPTEFGVRTGVGVRYPDVVVDRPSTRRDSLACEAPIFLAEVLSPSTEDVDFVEKLQEYRAIASVQTYLICSQDEPRAWVWQRRADGTWPERPVVLEGRESAITLPEFGIELPMAGIFQDIPDPPGPAS